MNKVALRAHFDGQQIRLDEPFQLEPSMPLTVIVGGGKEDDPERQDWLSLSKNGLAAAYEDDEPEYSLDMIKEPNPDYERG